MRLLRSFAVKHFSILVLILSFSRYLVGNANAQYGFPYSSPLSEPIILPITSSGNIYLSLLFSLALLIAGVMIYKVKNVREKFATPLVPVFEKLFSAISFNYKKTKFENDFEKSK